MTKTNGDVLVFTNFLSEPEAFSDCKQFWDDLLVSIAQLYGLELVEYLSLSQNAKVLNEFSGNPIAAKKLTDRPKAIRIIQEPLEENEEAYLDAWLNTFAAGEPIQVHELVITTVPSTKTISYTTMMIEHWLTNQIQTEDQLARWLQPWATSEEE